MNIDPVTTEVVASRLREAASTMEHALYHSGYSPILRESKDGTAGLTDKAGRVVILSGGIQFHYTAYEQSVQALLARYPLDKLRPGDSFVCNDPYKCGMPHASGFLRHHTGIPRRRAHRLRRQPRAQIGHRRHRAGIRGRRGAQIYHDGIMFPPVRYQTAQGIEESIEAIIANNSRVAEVVLGDLRAQVGSTRIGCDKLAALCDEYGRETVLEVMQRLIVASARRLETELLQWSDGEIEAEGFLDHDGVTKDQPVRVYVTARKQAGRLTIDFTGSAPQGAGPVNLGPCTARAASMMAILASCDPTIAVNAGIQPAGRLRVSGGERSQSAPPRNHEPLFPFGASRLQHRPLGALEDESEAAVAPSGLGSGAVTIGYRKARGGKPAVLTNCSIRRSAVPAHMTVSPW